MEPTHVKLHTQTILVRKIANDKEMEDCLIVREYQRKKVQRRKSWFVSVLKLQIENLDIE